MRRRDVVVGVTDAAEGVGRGGTVEAGGRIGIRDGDGDGATVSGRLGTAKVLQTQ